MSLCQMDIGVNGRLGCSAVVNVAVGYKEEQEPATIHLRPTEAGSVLDRP